jgi:hypothetical protein
MASLPRRRLTLGTETKDIILLTEKFIIFPATGVVFDIMRNAHPFLLAVDDVVMKARLPSEFKLQFIGGYCYRRFKTADYRCQIF